MNESGLVNLHMKKMDFLQILELFTDLKNIHNVIHIKIFRISPFIKAMLIEIIFYRVNGRGITVFCEGNWF